MSLNVVGNVVYGGDPELFIEQGGQVVGSEKVLPLAGLRGGGYAKPCVVRDGVQVELNPAATTNLTILGRNIAVAMDILSRQLKDTPFKPCWAGLVEVSRAELDSLSETSRILGCQPSKNIYGEKPITVDAKTYQKRSAGGHLHFGLRALRSLFNSRADLVVPFDIFVGNTCVLLDRDPGAAERRENYGRAGEYRDPDHGLEYRTLSNFWLRNYSLTNLVYGLAGIAISVVNDSVLGGGIEQELIDTVCVPDFVEAIDKNDWNLARLNFEALRPFFVKHLPEYGFPLAPSNLDRFITLAEGVRTGGLETFFPDDPVTHWTKMAEPGTKYMGFSEFLSTIY